MRQTLWCVVQLTVLFLASSGVARAQTVAVGPYYATPSWDQTFACSTAANCPRFVVLANFNNEAVLDRETGLVWQRTVGGAFAGNNTWEAAFELCSESTTGGRQGWRLPSLHELQSLVDASIPYPALALPPGHPFLGVSPAFMPYWTGATDAAVPDNAFFTSLQTSSGPGEAGKVDLTQQLPFWCVRGGGPVPIS